jgi:hypothetical protein
LVAVTFESRPIVNDAFRTLDPGVTTGSILPVYATGFNRLQMSSNCCDHSHSSPPTDSRYRKVLCTALGINLAMFAVEIVASIIAGSVSLRADALDFLADAANYNYIVALAVVGLALRWRARAGQMVHRRLRRSRSTPRL